MKDNEPKDIVEYFENLVKYMRSLGYEDPRDRRINDLEQEVVRLKNDIEYFRTPEYFRRG